MENWILYIRNDYLTYIFKAITFLCNEEFLYLFLPIPYWCWKKRSGAHLMLLVIIAGYISFLLKTLFAWGRPPDALWLINTHGYTFPSTHAVFAVILWGFLAMEVKKKWFTILIIPLIALIAFSRVYLGVHYPQDVIAGLSVGAMILFSYRLVLKWIAPLAIRLKESMKILILFAISMGMLFSSKGLIHATASGIFAGVSIGLVVEPHFADFSAKGKLYKKILRYLLGGFILVAVWQGLEILFPSSFGFRFFQAFILGLWISVASPWLFVQLRLADQEFEV